MIAAPMFNRTSDAICIEEELGSGGSGAVYKAWHTRLQKHVVIKELKHSPVYCMEAGRNEVEALKNIKSPYLPQVLDFLMDGERSFTMMELVEGESFDKLLARGQRFTETQVIKWYRQLAEALVTIHRQNVCHRDIKPANIMLTPGGDVCLIDFNAALVGENDSRLVSRSLGYASPEQYEIFRRAEKARAHQECCEKNEIDAETSDFVKTQCHNEDVTETTESARESKCHLVSGVGRIDWKRSDIYSLGATMYHLLTGVRPPKYAGKANLPSKSGNYSKGVIYVIERSMKASPADRFASASALADAISNIHKRDSARKHSQAKKAAVITSALAITALMIIIGRVSWGRMSWGRFL